MKKVISVILILALIFLFAGCSGKTPKEGKTEGVKIDIRESSIFTEKDRNSAVDFIINKVENDGSIEKLYSVTYAGDEESKSETEYYKDLEYDEIIVFYIDFHSVKGSEADGFNGDFDYEAFAQMLGRDKGGEWEFVTGGYA